MSESIKSLFFDLVNSFSLASFIDIAITAFLIYKIANWLKGTQAAKVAKGILIIVLITQISDWVGLITINYVFKSLLTVGLLALVIVFQPELRRALEKLGSTKLNGLLNGFFKSDSGIDADRAIDELVEAVGEMAKTKTGALIIFERTTRLEDIKETGVYLDSVISKELLLNIFYPNTQLHDGAVLIDKDTLRIKAAGCLLPLTQDRTLNKEIGTRHRSAIGMSENSDCLALVVSEETGVISYAINGKLSRFIDTQTLKNVLMETLSLDEHNTKNRGDAKNDH